MSLTPRIDRLDRNFIINGGMDYFQRGGVSSAIAVGTSFDYITLDRFDMRVTGTWTSPTSERSTTKLGSLARYSHLFQGTPTALSDTFVKRQKIEAVYARELINERLSLGLLYSGNNFTTLTVTMYTADVEDDFSTVTQVDQKVFTILDDGSTNQVVWEDFPADSGADRGLMVEFEFSGLGALSATELYIGEIKLNIGSDLQDFGYFMNDAVHELTACQRYFEKSYPLDTDTGSVVAQFNTLHFITTLGSTNVYGLSVDFVVEKRVIPIVTFYNQATGAAGEIKVPGGSTYTVSSVVYTNEKRAGYPICTASVPANTELIFHISADAEL